MAAVKWLIHFRLRYLLQIHRIDVTYLYSLRLIHSTKLTPCHESLSRTDTEPPMALYEYTSIRSSFGMIAHIRRNGEFSCCPVDADWAIADSTIRGSERATDDGVCVPAVVAVVVEFVAAGTVRLRAYAH